jgi:hypothetical protein
MKALFQLLKVGITFSKMAAFLTFQIFQQVISTISMKNGFLNSSFAYFAIISMVSPGSH